MKTKTILASALAFAVGFGACALLDAVVWSSPSRTIAKHWRAIERYRAYLKNPANSRLDPQSGLSVTDEPLDPLPSLAALVAAGELEHVDLVLPIVPRSRRTTRYWMRWAQSHEEDVLHTTLNPSYVAYRPAGDQPLHIRIWFREAAEPDVQQLIKDLEALASGGIMTPSAKGVVSRQAPASQVPPHPLRARYLGEWQEEGKTSLVIATGPDGTVTIRSPQIPSWDSVINNVRWDGDKLRYDEYLYYTGPEDFTTFTNRTGAPPFSGVKIDTRLALTEGPDRLRQSVTTPRTPKPIEGDLTRAPGGNR